MDKIGLDYFVSVFQPLIFFYFSPLFQELTSVYQSYIPIQNGRHLAQVIPQVKLGYVLGW